MSAAGSDKRTDARRRTRLRSGKLADSEGRFLGECVIHDRSAQGARLRLDDSGAVPDEFLLFEDDLGALVAASVIWRRQNELGIRFRPGPRKQDVERIARRLGGTFYAV